MKCIRDDVMWDNATYLTFHTNFTIATGGGGTTPAAMVGSCYRLTKMHDALISNKIPRQGLTPTYISLVPRPPHSFCRLQFEKRGRSRRSYHVNDVEGRETLIERG